eukprot:Gb_14397 [translate_table: standard]
MTAGLYIRYNRPYSAQKSGLNSEQTVQNFTRPYNRYKLYNREFLDAVKRLANREANSTEGDKRDDRGQTKECQGSRNNIWGHLDGSGYFFATKVENPNPKPIKEVVDANDMTKLYATWRPWEMTWLPIQRPPWKDGPHQRSLEESVRSNILVLIGYAVERFPHLFQEENLNVILRLCLDTLEEQLHQTGKDPLYVLVSGTIKCLDSLLVWFDETLPAGVVSMELQTGMIKKHLFSSDFIPRQAF